ncbi:hypothetical protein [Azospirillum himalayense]|uniref:PepSY domain-containing protein n=1 Tax=Azospirillum himalayense TaxID=654847 RepID=A0ABW0GFU3_9PROT
MRIRYDQPGARLCRIVDAASGEPITNVIEADDTEGWYVAYKLGPDGKFVLSADRESCVTERVERPITIIAPA